MRAGLKDIYVGYNEGYKGIYFSSISGVTFIFEKVTKTFFDFFIQITDIYNILRCTDVHFLSHFLPTLNSSKDLIASVQ